MKHTLTLFALALLAPLAALRAAEPSPDSIAPHASLQDKTLVAWVTLANLSQRGGSVLAIDDRAEHFDAIVFGEIAPAKWMAGSEMWSRTEQQQDGWPAETADANTLVQIAAVYKGNEIVVYRNGEEYSRHTVGDPVPLKAESLVIIGQRYFNNKDFFEGSVEDARIYDCALSAEQIAALKPKLLSELEPWAWFTFEDAEPTERTGRFPHVRLSAGAKVEQGRLQLNGKNGALCAANNVELANAASNAATNAANADDVPMAPQEAVAPAPESIAPHAPLQDKTLVAWVTLANLTQHGGGVLAIDDRAKHFDAIVFGEIAPAKWMAGSELWSRTEQQQDGWPAETADANTLVQIAAVYKGNEIVVYRNGEEYSRHTVRDSVPLKPESLVIIGQRVFGAEEFFKGAVEDARIYDCALSAEQIAALKPKVLSELKPWAWFTFEDAEPTERTGRFPHVRLSAGAKVEQGRLQLNGKNGALCAANNVELANAASNAATNAANANRADAVRFWPENRRVGDVMPFYWKGEYHLFYILNASGNYDINWEHAVSKDLVHWRNLPAAIVRDPAGKTGPEGGCMFTGSIIEAHGTFHAFYTSWNPKNPAGREFICHATSKDLISWTKHPEDMIAPDGIHYNNNQIRDFRDPCVVWDEEEKQYVMTITANRPGKGGLVYGRLTSRDLKRWEQLPAIENIPGDECPDFFQAGETFYMHGCNVYAFAKNKNGPWQFPSYNMVDRRMAAKRVFDGERHVWFGGWLGGPMSIPREVYEGPDGLLLMKPVPEIVNVFSEVALSVSDLSLAAGSTLTKAVPLDYMLTATVDLSKGQEFGLTVRGDGKAKASRIVLSADTKTLQTTGRQGLESRPLPIDFGRPVTVQAFILGGVAEVFVNSQFAATFFIDAAGGTLGLESRGSVVVQSLQVRTPVTRNPEKP